MKFLSAIFKSKKLGAATLGVVVQLLTLVGLDPEIARDIAQLLMVYIGGQSVVDLGLAVKGTKRE